MLSYADYNILNKIRDTTYEAILSVFLEPLYEKELGECGGYFHFFPPTKYIDEIGFTIGDYVFKIRGEIPLFPAPKAGRIIFKTFQLQDITNIAMHASLQIVHYPELDFIFNSQNEYEYKGKTSSISDIPQIIIEPYLKDIVELIERIEHPDGFTKSGNKKKA